MLLCEIILKLSKDMLFFSFWKHFIGYMCILPNVPFKDFKKRNVCYLTNTILKKKWVFGVTYFTNYALFNVLLFNTKGQNIKVKISVLGLTCLQCYSIKITFLKNPPTNIKKRKSTSDYILRNYRKNIQHKSDIIQ